MTIRVYQDGAEVILQPDDTKLRAYQSGAEVAFQPNDTKIRLYQAGIEVLVASDISSPLLSSAVAAVVNPTVEIGGGPPPPLEITPDPISAVAASLDPTVVLGSISITPTQGSAVAATVDPTIPVAPVEVTPDPAEAWTANGGNFVPLVVRPDPASSRPTTIDPTYAVGIRVEIITGSDDAHQLDNGSGFKTGAKKLELVSSSASRTRSHVGLRFQSIQIPEGATVLDARLNLYNSGQYDDPRCTIYLQAADNPPTFSASSTVVTRNKTAASTAYQQDNLAAGWDLSPDFHLAVQEVIDRPGWTIGNSIAVILWAASDAVRRYYPHSFENHLTPELIVLFSPPAVEEVTIEPNATQAVGRTGNPVVVLTGEVIVQPPPPGVIPTVVNPTVVQSGMSLTPPEVTAVASVTGPDLAWKVQYTPDTLSAVCATTSPEVVIETEGIWWTPDPAVSIAAAVDPTIDDVRVSPDPAYVLAVTVDPASSTDLILGVDPAFCNVESAFGPIYVAPDAITSIAAAVDPTVVLGSITFTPSTSNAVVTVSNPAVVLGSLSITPDALGAVAVAVDPTVGNNVTYTPTPLFTVADVALGEVVLSSASVQPDPAQAIAATVDPATLIFMALVALTLTARGRAFTLNDRSTGLTLEDRETALTLEDRGVGFTLAERSTDLTLSDR
jgi:hypothetical protein